MTLKVAEEIVRQYATVLAREVPDSGPARHESWLPHSRERIVQAMKLVLAHSIENHSFTQELHNEIGTAASSLSSFVEDTQAQRINTTHKNRRGMLTPQHMRAVEEMHEFVTRAMTAGLSLRCELTDFIAAIQQLSPNDPLYRQRVCILAGVEYTPKKRRFFWE